jgi:hypothetical protein
LFSPRSGFSFGVSAFGYIKKYLALASTRPIARARDSVLPDTMNLLSACSQISMGFFSSKKPEPQESEEDKRWREHREYMEVFWPYYLHKGKVLESWSGMVDGGKGKFEEFINNVADRVRAVKIPDLKEDVRGLYFDVHRKQSQIFYVFWRHSYFNNSATAIPIAFAILANVASVGFVLPFSMLVIKLRPTSSLRAISP